MPIINITVADKHATLVGTPVIVCDNTDYSVKFTFDAEWGADTLKTARFAWVADGKRQHTDVIFTGDTVAAPILADIWEVYVGVFEGDLSTTTPARIYCERSIRSHSGQPAEEYPGQYDHIMALFQQAVDQQAQAAEDAQTAQDAAQRAENAAVNVEAIVAGNEAYTKAENDSRDAPAIVESATGAAIVVEDAADRPLHSLVLHGKATQASAPTPDAPVDLVSPSGALSVNLHGKNLVEITATTATQSGVTFTINQDKSVTISGTATATVYFTLGKFTLPNGFYILSGCTGGGSNYVLYFQKTSDYSGYTQITTKEIEFEITDGDERTMLLAVYSGATVSTTLRPMIRAAVIKDSNYEEYKEPQALSYELPGKFCAGTLDCMTGVLNYGTIIDLETDEWGPGRGASGWVDGFETVGKETIAFHHHLGAEKENYYPATLCSHFPAAAKWADIVSASTEMAYRGNSNGLAYAAVRIKRSRLTEYGFVDDGTGETAVAAFTAWLEAQAAAGTPVQFVGEIKNTAQLVGAVSANSYKLTTTVLNDAGLDMDLEYVADTKAYISKTYPSFEGVAF